MPKRQLRLKMDYLGQGESLLLSRQAWDSAYGCKILARQDPEMLH
jgi:hypothetical protein